MKNETLFSVAVVLGLTVATAMAQSRSEHQSRGPGGPVSPEEKRVVVSYLFVMSGESPVKKSAEEVAKLDLTSAQKEKLADWQKEYEPKFKELRVKALDVLTDEQKTVVTEAGKIVDKGGEDIFQAIGKAREKLRALNLTEEQIDRAFDISREARKLANEARKKVDDMLTDEQRKKLTDERMKRFTKERQSGVKRDQNKDGE